MSMLSAQCDELRAMAESVGLAMPQAATLMMEAADTIEGLEAENAKLEDTLRRRTKQFEGMTEMWVERGVENAKLRELLIDVSEEVPWSFMDTTKYYMPLRADKLRKLLCRMRELGIEVSG